MADSFTDDGDSNDEFLSAMQAVATRDRSAPQQKNARALKESGIFADIDNRPTVAITAADLNIDLNDEKNIGALEDPGLAERMKNAREQYARDCANQKTPPEVTAVVEADHKARAALSTVVMTIEALRMAAGNLCEEVALVERNTGRLANAERPHGYPEPPSISPEMKECLLAHKKRASRAFDGMEALLRQIDALACEMTLARRKHEATVDGYRRLLGLTD